MIKFKGSFEGLVHVIIAIVQNVQNEHDYVIGENSGKYQCM